MFRLIPYIWKSARRSKVRTTLTMLGVMVAIGIYALLASLESSMDVTIDSVAQQSLLILNEKDQW